MYYWLKLEEISNDARVCLSELKETLEKMNAKCKEMSEKTYPLTAQDLYPYKILASDLKFIPVLVSPCFLVQTSAKYYVKNFYNDTLKETRKEAINDITEQITQLDLELIKDTIKEMEEDIASIRKFNKTEENPELEKDLEDVHKLNEKLQINLDNFVQKVVYPHINLAEEFNIQTRDYIVFYLKIPHLSKEEEAKLKK